MRCHSFSPALAALVASSAKVVAGLNITNGDPDTLSLAVKQLSNGVMSIYGDNSDVDGAGIFPEPYYWWESGVAWDTLVNYWYLTGDMSNNAATQAALAQQAGEDDDYLPTNQALHEMNDDQATWALAAMTAAERGFPAPVNQTPWEELARTVFDSLAARWDTSNCGGGLRWSIFSFNAGYEYKNAISQAMFFQLAARLARFTGNQTYIDWAARTYDWSRSSGLIGEHFAVYDGTSVSDNCTRLDHTQWSYTAASFAYGSAILANITADSQWTDRTNSLLDNILRTFFPSNIMTETACEPAGNCNADQLVFPALTLRWLALIPVFQPVTVDTLRPALNASAIAAAHQCTVTKGEGNAAVAECKNQWSASANSTTNGAGDVDGKTGLGQQLAALEALQSRYVFSQDGVNASVVLRVANGTSSSGNGSASGSGSGGTSTSSGSSSSGSSSGSTASAIGTSGAAVGMKASVGMMGGLGLVLVHLL